MRLGGLLGFGRKLIIEASEGSHKQSSRWFQLLSGFALERLDIQSFWSVSHAE